MKLEKILDKKNYQKTSMTKNKVGHFLINIKFNKQIIHAIIDSGASNTVFDKSWLEQQKYDLKPMESSGGGVGSSAVEIFSTKQKAKIRIDKIKIRPSEIYSMDFSHINAALAATEIDPIYCIVGADYLTEYHAIIDYKKEDLFLKITKNKRKNSKKH